MDLFITNIPAHTKNDELYDFIVSEVTGWWVKGVDREISR